MFGGINNKQSRGIGAEDDEWDTSKPNIPPRRPANPPFSDNWPDIFQRLLTHDQPTTMSRLFVRRLSTFPPLAAPGPSSAGTVPMAVKRRRALQPGAQRPSPLLNPEVFASGQEPFPPKLEDEFQELRAKGNFKGTEEDARMAFLKTNAAWRSRIRGGVGSTRLNEDGSPVQGSARSDSKMSFFAREGEPREDEAPSDSTGKRRNTIVGTKVWLPNIQIRLMRNHTPPGEAYDPNIATFRVPPSMTKNDIRSYLFAVYGLEVTFIRTDQYVAHTTRVAGGRIVRQGGQKKNYKRAVVGLTEPFHYPDDVEEMRAGTFGGYTKGEAQAAFREEVLNGEYAIEMVDMYRKGTRMKMHKGWRWRADTHDNAVSTDVVWGAFLTAG